MIHYVVGRNLGHLNPCVANVGRFLDISEENVKIYAFKHTHAWLRSNLPDVKIRSFHRRKVKADAATMLRAKLVMHDWREEVGLLKEARETNGPIIGGIYHSDLSTSRGDTDWTRKFKSQILDVSQRTTDIFFHINLMQPTVIPKLSTRYVPIPLIARPIKLDPQAVKAKLGIRPEEPFVLVQMGGGVGKYRYKYMDEWFETINRLQLSYPIVVANQLDGVAFSFRKDIIQAPLFDNGRELVNAAAVVVSKPGMGILMDCISTGTPLLALPADTKEREVKNLMLRDLVGHDGCLAAAGMSAKSLRRQIEALVADTPRIRRKFSRVPQNGADVVAKSMALLSGHSLKDLPDLYPQVLKLTPYQIQA